MLVQWKNRDANIELESSKLPDKLSRLPKVASHYAKQRDKAVTVDEIASEQRQRPHFYPSPASKDPTYTRLVTIDTLLVIVSLEKDRGYDFFVDINLAEGYE